MTNKPNEEKTITPAGLVKYLTEIPAIPEKPAAKTLPRHLTRASVIDVRNAEVEITDMMVRRACKEAEKYQQFPFGPKKSSG